MYLSLSYSFSVCSWAPFCGVSVMHLTLLSQQPPGSHQSPVSEVPAALTLPFPGGPSALPWVSYSISNPHFYSSFDGASSSFLSFNVNIPEVLFSFFLSTSSSNSLLHSWLKVWPHGKLFASPNFKSSCCTLVSYLGFSVSCLHRVYSLALYKTEYVLSVPLHTSLPFSSFDILGLLWWLPLSYLALSQFLELSTLIHKVSWTRLLLIPLVTSPLWVSKSLNHWQKLQGFLLHSAIPCHIHVVSISLLVN